MVGKKLGAAGVIQNKDGQILLVKHNYGELNWELPGGFAELNESIVETAKREIYEETGLIATPKRTTGIYYDPEIDMLHFVFLFETRDPGKESKSNSEISEFSYFSMNQLPKPINDFTILRIKDALSGNIQPLPVNI